jgi:hypothetical protein
VDLEIVPEPSAAERAAILAALAQEARDDDVEPQSRWCQDILSECQDSVRP